MAAAAAVTLTLTGCGNAGPSLEERLERAHAFESSGELSSAVIELKVAVQQAPGDQEVRLRLARTYLRMGDGVTAEKEIERARDLGIEPARLTVPLEHARFLQGNFQAIVEPLVAELVGNTPPPPVASERERAELAALRGRAQVRLGRPESAETWLDQALSIDPGLPWALVGRAELARSIGDEDGAREWLARALEDGVPAAEAWELMGDLEFAAGDFEAAAAAYAQAVDLEPYVPGPALSLADARIQAGRLDEAEAALDALSRKGFSGRLMNHLRSLIAYARGEVEQARTLADGNLSESPGYEPSLLVSGVANTLLGHDERAVHHLGRFAVNGRTMPPIAARALALSNLRLDRPEAALTALRAGRVSEEDDGRMHLAVAIANRDLDRAKGLLTAAVERDPGDTGALVGLAAFQLATGEREAARGTLASLPEGADLGDQDEKLRLAFLQLQAGNSEQALVLAQEVQRDANDRAAGFTVAGLALLNLQRRDEAAEAFRQALARDPGERPAAVSLALLYRTEGREEEALSVLRAARAANPTDQVILNQLAQLEFLQGNYEEAEHLLRAAATTPGATAQSRVILARLLLRTGRAKEALSFAEQAGRQAPDEADVLDVIARANQALGHHARAVGAFERLVAARPGNPDHHLDLARSLMEVRRVDAARQQVRRSLELDPSRHDARLVLVRLLLMGNEVSAAGEELAVLRRELPEEAVVAQLEAVHAVARGEPAEALIQYRRAFDLDPSAGRAAELARMQWSVGEREAAHDTLRQALALEDPAPARLELARTLYREERFPEAQEQYRLLVEEGGSEAALHNDYAWVARRAGDLETALAQGERALALAPDSPQIQDTLAAVLLDRGEIARALRLLRQATTARPDDLEIRFRLAAALVRGGEPAEARPMLERLAAEPTFDRRNEARELLDSLD